MLPDGPGPFEMTAHKFNNSAQKANWAQWLPAKEVTVVVFQGVGTPDYRTTLVGGLGGSARCAVSTVVVFSFYRYVPIHCVNPAGVTVQVLGLGDGRVAAGVTPARITR